MQASDPYCPEWIRKILGRENRESAVTTSGQSASETQRVLPWPLSIFSGRKSVNHVSKKPTPTKTHLNKWPISSPNAKNLFGLQSPSATRVKGVELPNPVKIKPTPATNVPLETALKIYKDAVKDTTDEEKVDDSSKFLSVTSTNHLLTSRTIPASAFRRPSPHDESLLPINPTTSPPKANINYEDPFCVACDISLTSQPDE